MCWAKLSSDSEMASHRETCKVNFGDDSNDNTQSGGIISIGSGQMNKQNHEKYKYERNKVNRKTTLDR